MIVAWTQGVACAAWIGGSGQSKWVSTIRERSISARTLPGISSHQVRMPQLV